MTGTALLCAALMAGCGDDDTETPDASHTSTAETERAAPQPAIAAIPDALSHSVVAGPREAQELAAARRAATPADPQTGYRPAARIEEISWPYGNCQDAQSLIPPPMEGWGLLNDTSLGEWPVGPNEARIVLNDGNLATIRNGHSEEVAFHIIGGTAGGQSLAQVMADPRMRDALFEAGPYGYPVQKGMMATMLGPYHVQVSGGSEARHDYFADMIRCAIDNGLVADGIALSSLRDAR